MARPWAGSARSWRVRLGAGLALAIALAGPALPLRALADDRGATPALDVSQILERNAAARGGLEAWRKVQTMTWSGHVERADGSGPRLPFTYQQKRPSLTRFELMVDKQASVRVFDGQQGWKLRPSASGQPEVKAYGEEERRAAQDGLVIDGPVLDAAAKGVQVTLDGEEDVEGHLAYRLNARLPSGTTQRVWIDARTFLELKYDRPARGADGRPTTVAVFLRDYQPFEGLQIPFTIETGTPGGGPVVDRLVIERMAINLALPDGMFARPGLRTARRGITVDTRTAPRAANAPAAPAP